MSKSSRKQKQRALQQRRQQTVIWSSIGVIAALLIGWMVISRLNSAESTPLADGTMALGEQLYVTNCAACHGLALEGQPNWQQQNPDGTLKAPPHDETGHTWHHGDGYLLDRIRYGVRDLDPQMQAASNMPGYKDVLTEAEMVAVLDYIKSEWPTNIQQTQSQRSAAETP
jgi:mono/diheme cytochrome c family protein